MRTHLGHREARKTVLELVRAAPEWPSIAEVRERLAPHRHAVDRAARALALEGHLRLHEVVAPDRRGRPRVTHVLAPVQGGRAGRVSASLPRFSGPALRRARAEAGVSRAALAEALAVSQSAVRWWEQARVVPPARGQEILRAVAHLRGRCTAERPLSAAIAKHLCAMRVAAGRTQAELAEELGISQSTVANWEAGRGLTRQNARRVHLALCRLGAAPRVDGHLLRAFRARHGWSQSELALRLGVGVATIKRWEAGRIAVPAHRAASILAVVGA